jgi:hypothetical protein
MKMVEITAKLAHLILSIELHNGVLGASGLKPNSSLNTQKSKQELVRRARRTSAGFEKQAMKRFLDLLLTWSAVSHLSTSIHSGQVRKQV